MKDIVLYSAIFGGYERAKPVPSDIGVRCVMFTDDPNLHAPGWDVIVGNPPCGDQWSPMMRHKWFKLHPHVVFPDARMSLWLDGSMTIIVNDYVQRCITALGNDDWSMVPHPARNCIYDEASFSATLTWKYDPVAIRAQADFYASIGHPAQWGLMATGANIRRHTPIVEKVNEQWWWENQMRSHQDQLSLPVIMRLNPELKYNYNLPWFEWWHLSEHGR